MSNSEFPRVADADWLLAHLGEADLVVGDVRGPNAHTRGHIPGSRPLVLGSPPPGADDEAVAELAKEVALRLRRHGLSGAERLVLVDRGDGVGAMPAAQMAELAGHRRVAILLGGMAAWQGELAEGPVELEPVRESSFEPSPRAFPTRRELAARLDDDALTILDVRRDEEYTGKRGNQCDPRQGHIPGAVNIDLQDLMLMREDDLRERLGVPEGGEVVCYCHSGSRSAFAVDALRRVGYDARNYPGSWHEWSRTELPLET
jgi:thiosulfate/3-mercaptopyruvate sulfurtransferase